jgi:two-component system nitrogen regulation response regulator NtrX
MSKSSVLVVDDEPLVRWSVSETLADAGYGVEQAHDEQSTLRAMSEADHSPDVVLLDVYLPDCSDLRVLASIRRMSPHTSVIMMTAHGSPQLAADAHALGAFAVLDKPFDMAVLPALVASALAA